MTTYTSTITRTNRTANMADWQRNHVGAINFPNRSEAGIVALLRGWLQYADTHKARYDSGIGEDGVLGKDWAAIGHALLGLLNGELGRLDGGSLDSLIRDTLTAEGFDPDNL
jgi:hypothetical protein